MEGFDLVATGVWSIVPPLLALALALITKEVYSSLTIGVFAGMVIYQFTLNGAGFSQLIDSFTMVPRMMAEQIAGNGALILFLALLGALVVVIASAGGSRAYGEWVSKHIKSARMAKVLTAVLGLIIFVDDYFNCLTVGAVMRPVTDRFNVSREKLAWLIDSTAAPVCIIAPVSSWAVAVSGYLGQGGFTTFIASIPYNFYALLTIGFVFFMCFTKLDFGPMKVAEAEAQVAAMAVPLVAAGTGEGKGKTVAARSDAEGPLGSGEDAYAAEGANQVVEDYQGITISQKGKVYDLVVPIIILIIFSIVGMMYAGGFFEGVEFGEAIGEDPVMGLNIGVSVALLVAACMFLPRKLMNLEGYVVGLSEGVRSMIGAIMILVLAWSLGGACRYLLGTGDFVSGFMLSLGVDMTFFPAVLFIVASLIAFSMGTSWGTIALIMPIVVGVFPPEDSLFIIAVGATLGGAVYGDHVSPISDTTILSSAGAQCNHLRHVATQLPYATLVMVICIIGYIICAIVGNPWVPLVISAFLIVVSVLVLAKTGIKLPGRKRSA